MISAQVCFRPFHDESKLSPSCINNQMFDDSSRSKDESILLYIAAAAAASGSEIPIRVLESHSIESVTLKIHTRANGFMMKKHKDEDVLHLVMSFKDLQVINVKTYSGKEFTLLSVNKFRKSMNKNGGDHEEQEVLCDGLESSDHQIINELCSHENSVVHIIVRESADQVRSNPTKNILELSITASNAKKRKRNDNSRGTTKGCKKETDIDHSPKELIKPVKSDNSLPLLEPIVLNPNMKLPNVVEDMIMQTLDGLEHGSSPVRTLEGTGGSYFMQDSSGENVSVFKPTDEEPNAINNPHGLQASSTGEGLKKGTKVGEGAFREVAAYVLDHPKDRYSMSKVKKGFADVPPTFMVKCLHSGFNYPDGCKDASSSAAVVAKFGSLQKYVKNYGSCEDIGPAGFPVSEVHKISVLDIRMANADRHAGNILVSKDDDEDGHSGIVLIPIDHGYCLPESFEDCTFEWLYWPQSRQPYTSETLEYIKTLDAEDDITTLKLYGWNLSQKSARTLRVSTMLLKKGVVRGLSPFAIGSIMCRETLSKPSVLEEILHDAQDCVLPGSSEVAFLESVSQIMDRRLARVLIV